MEQDEVVDIQTYLPGFDTVKSYTEDAFKAVVAATKAATVLPAHGDRYEYYQSFHGFCELMKEEAKLIFSSMSAITKSQGVKKSFENLNAEDAFELLCDVNDIILESADLELDEASGTKTKESQLPEDLVVASVRTSLPINTSWNKVQSPPTAGQTVKLLTARNIQRPQMSFKEKVDNSNTPFVPLIKWKPNAIKPLALLPEVIGGNEEYGHPYEWEIEKFQPTDEMLEVVEPVLPSPLEETEYIYVETEDQLKRMCEDLSHQKEIAIDLEHHSYRSFLGIVCLMQISTRRTDYIIDTFKLRSELQVLNEIFTHPKIVKVLHGADSDIVWLQRDFGLYIVNLFDTGQAARVLNFAHFSLAYLLKHCCKVETNKAFQLADWRIRPLPAEMIKYAREDTHYLLYIYDFLKNDLLQKGNEVKNLLLSAFQRSKIVSLKVYQKPIFHEDSYLELIKKSKKVFNSRQLFALKELYAWRERIAREEDESIGYVLPNHMLLQISEILPREQQGILACCNPIPPLVRQQLADLHSIILKARDAALSMVLETEQTLRPPELPVDVDLENILHCPHDVHHPEESLHLATLFGEESSVNLSSNDDVSEKQELSLPLREETPKLVSSEPDLQQKYEESVKASKSYLSPYQRFKLVREFNVAYKLGNTEESVSETDRIHRINDHFKKFAAVADGDNDVTASRTLPQKHATASTPQTNASLNKQDPVPLRTKKKNKRKHEAPDVHGAIPMEASKDDVVPSLKKVKTPENIRKSKNESQKPSEHDKSSNGPEERARIPSKRIFNPDSDVQEYQTPSKSWSKKKKHSRQATFSHSSDRSHSRKMNWPKQ